MNPDPSPSSLADIARQALAEVLSTFLSPDASTPQAATVDEVAAVKAWITGTVNLDSPSGAGRVHLHIPEALAQKAVDHLFGGFGMDLEDLAGELCNMVAGRIGAGLAKTGRSFTLHTPAVSRVASPPPAPSASPQRVRTLWRFWDLPLVLDIELPGSTP